MCPLGCQTHVPNQGCILRPLRMQCCAAQLQTLTCRLPTIMLTSVLPARKAASETAHMLTAQYMCSAQHLCDSPSEPSSPCDMSVDKHPI